MSVLGKRACLPPVPRWCSLAAVRKALLLLTPLLLLGRAAAAEPPAFPGAVGFGAGASGGRGGEVYHVTTLEDGGPGSLRDALRPKRRQRTVVFEVGGTIELREPLGIDKAEGLTVAGQTAPGGITLRGYPFAIARSRDVVIRYLRVRPGDAHARGVRGEKGRGREDLRAESGDGIKIGVSRRVLLDHVSVSWSLDEALSITKSGEVTLQHSILSESLNRSFHPRGSHAFGSLVRGYGKGGVSYYGNLYAHHAARNPAIGGNTNPKGGSIDGLDVDFVNNVVYDWGDRAGYASAGIVNVRLNYRGNVLVAGPSTTCPTCVFAFMGRSQGDRLVLYQDDNWHDPRTEGEIAPQPVTPARFTGKPERASKPFAFSRTALEPRPALEAYDQVLEAAGASLTRDAVDRRVVRQVRRRAGGIIDSQEQVGGWPEDRPRRSSVPDADRDGMDDRWECRRGLDPADPEDRNGRELAGPYTNLEVYLQDLVAPIPNLPESAEPAPACRPEAGG